MPKPLPRLSLTDMMKGSRIVGGVETAPNEFPFQISLQGRGFVGGYSFFCGGTVYNENWIITAAHCAQEYAAN